MKNIFDTLQEIKTKPEMYLGAKKLTYLYHFINGYLLRSIDLNDNVSPKIRNFHFWIPKMTEINHENWLQNILTKTNFEEEKAMDLFFVYLEQFMDETKPLASEKSEGID